MNCSKCKSNNWTVEKEKIIAESKKWPIKLHLTLDRWKCKECGHVYYWAGLDSDSQFPLETHLNHYGSEGVSNRDF